MRQFTKKGLQEQVAKLSKEDREKFISQILDYYGMWHEPMIWRLLSKFQKGGNNGSI